MSSDENKSRDQLVNELHSLRLRLAEMEASKTGKEGSKQAGGEDLEQFRDLIDGSIVMVQNIGLDGHFRFVNRTWRETLGYSESDIEPLSFFEIVHPDFRDHCKKIFAQIVSGESIRNIEAIFLTKDGSNVIVEGNCGPQRLGDKVSGILGFFQDITPRKQVETALRVSERRLELALESAVLGLWDHNLKTGEVIRNKRWAEMLGYTLAEIDSAAQAWKHLIHPDDLPIVEKIAKEHEEGQIPFFKVEHRLRCKTGEWKWILNWGKVVERDEEGRPVRATGTHLDISELKRKEEERVKLEALIQQTQKAESLDVMAGSIAHNFNNLLMVILGNLEMALDGVREESPLMRHMVNAEKAAKHAAELSTLMLTYVGQTKVNMQVINLSKIVEGLIEVLELALSKKAQLRFNPSPESLFFQGDMAQLRQVIMNLVTNAAEAVGDGEGTVTLSSGTVFCDRNCFRHPFINDNLSEGDYVYFDIRDTGCGMDQETLSRIFDPFFTTKFQGRGLGMAVVLGIVRAHRGSVSIKSAPGKGTTVRVMFPAVDTEEEDTREESPVKTTDWRGSGIILLVDDEKAVLEVAEAMLQRLGFSVLTAHDGLEAIEIFREKGEDIGCVLLDLLMPQMDGVETFRELRRIKEDVRVVLSSGYTEEKASELFDEAVPAGFIKKPYNLDRLRDKLREFLAPPKK
ncbi:PAS domain S-box protein [Acidobacteriota bacterium]